MRILYMTPGVFDKGGISRYCRYQIRALRDRFGNGNVRVLSLRGPGTYSFEFEDEFPVFWYGGKPDFISRARFSAKALEQAISFSPDVALSAHVNFSPLNLLLGRISGARTFLNVYGLEVWSGLSTLRRKSLERHRRIISDCHNTGDYIRKNFLLRGKIDVIWDPVDLKVFRPVPRRVYLLERFGVPHGNGEFYAMTVCRLAKIARHKGVERILQVFRRLKEFPQIHYLIGGDGDDRGYLEEMAENLGVKKNVHFLGSIREKEMADVYNLCDLFVMVTDMGPSRGEGIPMTPMEAGACGRPILVGNQDGSKEIINDGEGGFILDPFDLDKIAGTIKLIYGNPDLQKRLQEQILKRISRNFSFEVFARKTIMALEK